MFSTREGWTLIAVGCGVGFFYAALVLAISVVSFPLLLDREVGVPVAIATSLRVARENPATVAVWGLIVAAGLALGALPFFLGLIVILPILGVVERPEPMPASIEEDFDAHYGPAAHPAE